MNKQSIEKDRGKFQKIFVHIKYVSYLGAVFVVWCDSV